MYKHTEEAKLKIGLAQKGKKISDATKLKMSLAKKGKPNGRLGTKQSDETKRKIGLANSIILKGKPNYKLRGRKFPNRSKEKHFAWKGEKSGYRAKHSFISRHYGKADCCEKCFIEGLNRYHWSNISGEYNHLDRNDWQKLCPKCHKQYDMQVMKGINI